MAEAKTQPTGESVNAFLDRVTVGDQRKDCAALVRMMKGVAKAPAKMWGSGIVGFGTCPIQYASGRTADWPIVAFAPRKPHITLYLSGVRDRRTLLDKLGTHKMSGGCLHIKRMSDVDPRVLERIVSESVKSVKKKHAKSI